MRNSKKIIQKGGIISQVTQNIKNKIKKTLNPGESELAFCDLRQPQYRPNSVTNFKSGIPIIIVKKKNDFNQSSNYYAIKMPEPAIKMPEPAILAEGLGKKEFYDNLIIKKSNNSNENKLLATKILIFFKLNWGNNPPFSEDFYNLNTYFMSKTL